MRSEERSVVLRPEERMSNSRKILSLILVTMLAVCLVACSKEDTAHPEEPVMEESQDNIEVEIDAEEELLSFEVVTISPAMIKVENLPEWLKESDLENGFISTHKLMEIAKKMGKDLELEADGKVYTIKPNMVLYRGAEIAVAETEEDETKEEVIEQAEPTVETAVESPSQSAQTTPSQPAQPSQPSAHEHNWVAVTEQVWVEDKAAWDETVLVKEAWDEETVTYEWQWVNIGYKTGDGKMWATKEEAQAHAITLPVDQGHYSTIADEVQVPITTTIHHDAEYTTVHHDATGHYEDVVVGYKCSSCGATK